MLTEIEHLYGSQVHILDDVFLNSVLTELCLPGTFQPKINHLVEILYSRLATEVISRELDQKSISVATRMTASHADQKLHTTVVNPEQKVVCVNIARAGTYPSHICYQTMHYAVHSQYIRQDHIFAARMTDDREHVTGSQLGGVKIGGDVDDAFVLFPDPMGATGNTIISAIDYYKTKVKGPARKYIALHLIVTPEYLKKVTQAQPDAIIYALRLDRGLSPDHVKRSKPGTHWDLEKGLNNKDYIVPGGGGFGEIMNNSFV